MESPSVSRSLHPKHQSSPIATRANHVPCNCKFCGGKLRDRRTVRRHFQNHPYSRPKNDGGSETERSFGVLDDEHDVTIHTSGHYVYTSPTHQMLMAANIQSPSNDEISQGVDSNTSEQSQYNCVGDSNCSEDENDDQGEDENENGDGGEDEDQSEDGGEGEDHSEDWADDEGEDEEVDEEDVAEDEYQSEDGGEDENASEGEDQSEDEDEDQSEGEDRIDKELEKCCLRILASKVKYGWSQEETLSQLQNLYELTKNDHIPHKTWAAVMVFLKKLGYKNPRHFKVCCGKDHITLIDSDSNECPNCNNPKDKCIDYFVLGLNLDSTFVSKTKTKDHLSHWEAKDEWLNKEVIDVPYKEIWHGARFRELSYFWDESRESVMPTCCPNCKNIISVDEIVQAAGVNGLTAHNPVNLSCRECTFDFVYYIKIMKGNPLNQAFIFHEDGFNAFSKKTRGIAAIHVSNACTKKEQRLHGKSLRVYSFIPTYLMKEGIPHKMDAFLKPLVDEVTKLYINGIDVYVPQAIELSNELILEGNYKVRALLLLGTADLKGHQEIILYAGGGRLGCRRCLVIGTYVPCKRHYYYGSFGERYRNPSALRTASYQLEHGKRVDNAPTLNQRHQIQTETGVCGVTILFDLYKLYKFNPILDMTIDRMHLTFNMLKREFLGKMWPDIGDNAGKAVDDRDPEVGGLVIRGEFNSALQAIEWTSEEKAKGVARMQALTDKLGGWKSNEFKRFSSVAKEILAQRVPSKAYDCYMLLCDAVQMLYSSKLQANGWSNEHIERLEKLLWSHAIRAEEYYGLGICTENLEYSVHASQDIRRHSSMDNYSCELYERAILRHKEQKHNAKGLEKTFATRENLRNFLDDYQEMNGPLSQYNLNKKKYNFDLDSAADPPICFHESSFSAAKAMLQDLQLISNPEPSLQHAISYGVAIGLRKKKVFEDNVITDVRRFFNSNGINAQGVPNILLSFKAIALRDEVGDIETFTKGTTCKIASDNGQEWIMEITDIFQVGPAAGNFYTFVNGPYFIPTLNNGNIAYHEWTQTEELISRTYMRNSIQPACKIKRKVIMYPDPANLDNPQFYICIDFKNPELVKEVKVPIYPRVGETVSVLGTANDTWFGIVRDVDHEVRKARVLWYRETRRQWVWTLTDQEDQIYFKSIINVCILTRVFGGYSITCT